jgi:arylsulfatase
MAETPNIQALADQGLIFNNFHTVGLCSPTRAALLTGRNHHQVGFGTIVEMSTGFPGYNTLLPRDSAVVAKVLKENGYSTVAYGKWHNTPDWETTAAGPFDRWPTGLGFEYWYGFSAARPSHYEPQLY